MGLDDLVNSETAVVAAATAAMFSPRTRSTLRRGAVLGVAGALKVGDVVAGAARGATRGVRGEEKVDAVSKTEVASAAPRRTSSGSPRTSPDSPRTSSGSSRASSAASSRQSRRTTASSE